MAPKTSEEATELWTEAFWEAVAPVVCSTGYFAAEDGWQGQRIHVVQTDFDLWYVLGGAGEVCIDGIWHRFSAGQLLTIKPGEDLCQERTVAGTKYQIYYVHILPFGGSDTRYTPLLAQAWPRVLPVQHRTDLGLLFAQLLSVHATRSDEHSLAVRGTALQLLGVLFEELRTQAEASPPLSHPRALRAREFVEHNYAQNIALADIAQDCGLSPAHLCVLFRRHFGRSPIDYLIHVRLQEAKLLLARGLSVKEVAAAVGVNSQHYFARLFRQKTGETPSEFAARYRRR